MFEVTFFLKSGSVVTTGYEDKKDADSLADVIVDPTYKVIALEQDDEQMFLPIANIDCVRVTNVQ